jgi:hypothetical protein
MGTGDLSGEVKEQIIVKCCNFMVRRTLRWVVYPDRIAPEISIMSPRPDSGFRSVVPEDLKFVFNKVRPLTALPVRKKEHTREIRVKFLL